MKKDEENENDQSAGDDDPEPWRWGDECGEDEDESEPLFTAEQERIIAEAELHLATGMTIKEIAELFRRAR